MAGGDERHGKEPAPMEVDKFPEGMRVLAVDDDRSCLRVLDALLRHCNYEPTTVADPRTALELLRDGGEDQFDLVITDVHMPDMDGFKLLELIGLEMDLPVIMMSVDGEKDTVYKGIAHGACDYLVKPVNLKELTNIWQHVLRKNLSAMNNTSESDDDDQRVVQPVIIDGEKGGSSTMCSKNKKNDGEGSDENEDGTAVPTTRKKRRVSWNGELHRKFLEVVNRLGPDRAYPKTILKMMDVDYLTRSSVASHLQKYRIYLKRVNDVPRKFNLLGEPAERRNSCSCMNRNHQGSVSDHHEHHRGVPSSALAFQGSNSMLAAPSVLGTVGHGCSTLGHAAVPCMPETRRCHASGHPVNSCAKVSEHTMLDAFPSRHYDREYANYLREKMLEERHVVPPSHPAGNSFANNMPNSGLVLEPPVNQLPVQPQEVICKHSAVGERRDTRFTCQNVTSSGFPNAIGGAPLIPAQVVVNNPQMNQVPSFGTLLPAGHMPIFQNEQQNQMSGIVNNNNNTPPLQAAGFNQQTMAPLFGVASNTAQVEITSDNFSPAVTTQMVNNGGSTGSMVRNLQTGGNVVVPPPTQMVNNGAGMGFALRDLQHNSVAPPTQMLNGGGDASRVLPVQEGPAGHQLALDDQPTYSIPFSFFAGLPNQDISDDAFFGGQS